MASSYNAKEEDGHVAVPGGGTIKNKKPDNTAFKQQRVPAWQPILTAGTVLPAFFVIGLIFIPIGIGLYVTSNHVKEVEIDYTGTDKSSPCFDCSQSFSWKSTRRCTCALPFSLEQPFESNVFMYYGLSNFYQNHWRYVKSRDDSQLNGDPTSLMNPSKECEPYARNEKNAHCAVISILTDTLGLYYIDPNGTRIQIPLMKKGIAWWTDKNVKFKNPGGNPNLTIDQESHCLFLGNSLSLPPPGTTKPINWRKPWKSPTVSFHRQLLTFFSTFFNELIPDYPVRRFEGRKRNPFLGIAYITVGSVSFFLGVVLIIHHKYGSRNNSADIPN
uniref:Cell cycle control protein n=1 Tax=Hucho hucho TaxID=62062 RepID=A0A4W5MUP0_9TELE